MQPFFFLLSCQGPSVLGRCQGFTPLLLALPGHDFLWAQAEACSWTSAPQKLLRRSAHSCYLCLLQGILPRTWRRAWSSAPHISSAPKTKQVHSKMRVGAKVIFQDVFPGKTSRNMRKQHREYVQAKTGGIASEVQPGP